MDDMTTTSPAPPEIPAYGQVLVGPADQDTGVCVRYPRWHPLSWVRLRTCLDDGYLERAVLAGKAASTDGGKTMSQRAFKESLIAQMVLASQIHRPDGSTFPLTPVEIAALPAPVKDWLVGEINRCDGTMADLASVNIGGIWCTFRAAA